MRARYFVWSLQIVDKEFLVFYVTFLSLQIVDPEVSVIYVKFTICG